MNKEIERKFLLCYFPDGYDKECKHIEQHYISEHPEVRIRKINDIYTMTIKSDGDLIRSEFERAITKEEFFGLKEMSLGCVIKKRYIFGKFEIDVYENICDLKVVEVEFDSVSDSEKFIKPDWLGTEITYDKKYKSKNLALQK